MPTAGSATPSPAILGDSLTARALRAHDWSTSSLGHPADWPPQLRQMVNYVLASPESMYLLWGQDLHFFSNDAYRPILGPRLSASIGTTLAQLWPDAIDAVRSSIDTAFAGDSVRYTDMPIQMARRGEPEDTWWTFSFSPLIADDGSVPGVLCHTRETTAHVVAARARDAAEDRLLKLNEWLESEVTRRTRDRNRIWEVSRDLLLVADPEGVWLSVNPAWTLMLGWSEAELLGRTSAWLEHPDDRTRTREEVDRLAEGQPTWNFENRMRARDGSYRTLCWTAIKDEDQLYCVAEDVTEHRAAEARLRQAQKMEAVGQLTGGIAHDFNNLLSTIGTSLELIKRKAALGQTADLARFTDAASRSVQSAAALTHRLLAFSRMQSLDLRPVDVNPLMQGIEEMLRRTLGERIDVELRLGEAVWPVQTDANQLENAVLNLAINARDAMPDGGRLTIATSNLNAEDVALLGGLVRSDCVVVRVTDTGTGMTAEVRERAFDPFFTTKAPGRGTGLGLSMIYGYVQQSGGHAAIQSEIGVGTTVSLYLPRADASSAPTRATANLPPRTGDGERILLVDDNDTLRRMLWELLSGLGYRVTGAPDAAHADAALAEQSFDLLITDVGLPDMSGRRLADRARELWPELPVLMITGYAQESTVRGDFLGAGMDMLTKPFDVGTFTSRIQQLLAKAAPAA